MAVSLLAHEVSDLCIGKPALTSLPLSSSVSDALRTLKRCSEPYLSVWTSTSTTTKPSSPVCVGKVCVVDIICLLCSDANLSDPSAALKSPLSSLLPPSSSPLVRTLYSHSSVLEALDLIVLEGTQNLVVPIRSSLRKKKKKAGALEFCCLSQEDFVRFFLNSIGLFSPLPALSIDDLGIIRGEILTVDYHDPAISAVGLIKQAALSQTAVAVVTDDGKLVGEISPSTLAFFGGGDESVAAAVAALTAGELMAYIDCGVPPSDTVEMRLKERNLKGMLDLLVEAEEEEMMGGGRASPFSSSSSSTTSSSSSSSSSSSDEESPAVATRRKGSGGRRRYARSGSYSARMGRRSEEAIVCHRGSSLVAVMIQALAHRVGYVWVVEEDYGLAGVVGFPDMLRVFRDHLVQ